MDPTKAPVPQPNPGTLARRTALALLAVILATGLWLAMRGREGGPDLARFVYPGSALTTNVQSQSFAAHCYLASTNFDAVSKYYEQILDMKNSGDPAFTSRTKGFFGFFKRLITTAKITAGADSPYQNRIYLKKQNRDLILIQLSSTAQSGVTAIRLTSLFLPPGGAKADATSLRESLEYPGSTRHSGGMGLGLTGFHYSTSNDVETVWEHYRLGLQSDGATNARTPPLQASRPEARAVAMLPALNLPPSAERTWLLLSSNMVASVSCYGIASNNATHLIISAISP